ncbi:MAG TPA: FtsX-like permease family protein [Acidimicrobiales bacterium]
MRLADYLGLAWRSLRRSRLRSGLTVSAIVVGATGLTIMLTFVTSVKSFVTAQFVSTGQIRQITVGQNVNLSYSPAGEVGGPAPLAPAADAPAGTGAQGGAPGPAAGTITLGPDMEAKITAIPHVTGVSAVLHSGNAIEYLSLGSKQLQVFGLNGYEPNGVIKPVLLAGRDLRPSDASGTLLVSQDYADALGFAGNYARLVGQTVDLHTMRGYSGAGAVLPDLLPPGGSNDCQGQRNCIGGPMASLPSLAIPATVAGVVDRSFEGQAVFVPLSWLVALDNQARPEMRPDQQPANGFGGSPQSPQPGRAGQPGQGPGPGQGQGQGPGQAQGQQGPGTSHVTWTHLDVASYIAGRGGYDSFLVAADNVGNVAAVAASIDRLGVKTATGLKQLNDQKSKANIVGAILGSLGLVALGIAALGVMNTMVMSVLERTREIGVMRALGARRSTIRRLFTFEAASLGFLGGLFGVVIGEAVVLGAKPVIRSVVKSGKVSGVSFSVPLWLILVVLGITTSIGLMSGLLPARRAARLDPVEALRYE